MSSTAMAARVPVKRPANTSTATQKLLACGAVAGPLYIASVVVQAIVRDGFSFTEHPASVLSNGDLGWLQIVTFLLTGALLIAGAAGLRRQLTSGPGSVWAPRLVTVVGAGMLAAGVFVADPMNGFPPGTPSGPPEQVSWHGGLHFLAGGVAFLALVTTCFVVARRLASTGRRGLATYSRIVGGLFLVGWIGMSVAPGEATNVAFAVAIGLGLHWLSMIMVSLDCHDDAPAGERAAEVAA